jgi:hypothetical protein
MAYFTTRDLAGITIFAALWGILNATMSPIFFQLFQLPFLCDMIGFASLTLVTWWVRKFGACTLVGFIATIINFMYRPNAFHFLGFTAASIVFDIFSSIMTYKNIFQNRLLTSVLLFSLSAFSAAIAGLIIGAFFMVPAALQRWGGTIAWAGLHTIGGIVGGAIGISLMNALIARGVTVRSLDPIQHNYKGDLSAQSNND